MYNFVRNLLSSPPVIILTLFGTLAIGLLLASPLLASAEAPAANGTVKYCSSRKMPAAVKAKVCTKSNLQKARDTATNSKNCRKATKSKFESCVTKESNKFVGKAAKNATTVQKFNDQLAKAIKDSGLPTKASAGSTKSLTASETSLFGGATAQNECGGGKNVIKTSIDFGCKGIGNAMLDLTFAIIRFLSNGAGLVIIGSLVWAGLQYTGSRGDPQATALAVNRIQSTFFALLIFIFAYAIINYLVPGTFLR